MADFRDRIADANTNANNTNNTNNKQIQIWPAGSGVVGDLVFAYTGQHPITAGRPVYHWYDWSTRIGIGIAIAISIPKLVPWSTADLFVVS